MTTITQWPPHRTKRKTDHSQQPASESNTPGPASTPHHHDTPLSSSPQAPLPLSPCTPLLIPSNRPAKKPRLLYRNGYKQSAPSTPTSSMKPYSLQTKTRRNLKPYVFVDFWTFKELPNQTPEQWNALAREGGLISAEGMLREFQIEAANKVISRKRDLCLIAPTGSGKSLVWMLPLLSQSNGISLVIIPYTSLGYQGVRRHENTRFKSVFVHGEMEDKEEVLEDMSRGGGMRIIYICPEMLETGAVARVLHSVSFRAQLSGVYIDEAHVIQESTHWRSSYLHLSLLRHVIGTDIPIIAISATLPQFYRKSIQAHAGMGTDYDLINLGNYRAELFSVVARMEHSARSFLDLVFVLPAGTTSIDAIPRTIIFSDDIELITAMFWWFRQRLRSFGLPISLVDILHGGLTKSHEAGIVDDMRKISNNAKILLGTDKLGAGVDFPGIQIVVQYRCRDLTLVQWEQRRGRAGRSVGSSAVGVLLVEPSMTGDNGELSVQKPKTEDPGLLDLIHSHTCHTTTTDYWLENPPRSSPTACTQCSNCNPELLSAIRRQDIVFIMEDPHSAAIQNTSRQQAPTEVQKALILEYLRKWRVQEWETEWKDDWPGYGPAELVHNRDLEVISARIHTLRSIDDLFSHCHILHLDTLAPSLLRAVESARCKILGITVEEPASPEHYSAPAVPASTYKADVRWATMKISPTHFP